MSVTSRYSRFARITALAGIFGFVLVAFGLTLLAFLKPGYDPVLSTISELGERGGVNAGIASAFFILIGVAEVLLAAGLYLRNRPSKAAFIGSLCLAVNGLFDYVGSGLFPCDARGTYVSFSGQAHFFVSVIGMTAMVFPACFYAFAFLKRGRKGQGIVAFVAACAILIGAVLFNVAFFSGAAWLGLAQRALDYAYWIWLFMLSLGLLRNGQDKG